MNKWFYKNKYIIHIVLIVIYVLWVINYFYPVLRFKFSLLNYIFALCVQMIPIVLLINGFLFKHKICKILNSIFFAALSLLSMAIEIVILIGIFTLSWKSAFKPIHDVKFTSYSVVAYRTNGGATTSYGIVVIQEKEIIKGILLVKNLYSKYPMYDVEMNKIGDNQIEINGEKIYLKRNVYIN
ncbi:MAG: hypothetical protein PWP22_828 [Thermoanaerobacter sp.]|nr:hypothetical protein [Thermoanaerobacter sp.]